jgi:class 3 adenylate cyclase
VFDAILRRAIDLCHGQTASLILAKASDTHLRIVASRGAAPETIALFDRGEVPMDPDVSFTARAILTGKTVHVEDMMDTDLYRGGVRLSISIVQESGLRTLLFVPLITAAGAIGAINIHRREVRPFAPDEIALAETFAAQAVIAIENVRQFRELQTRLDREAATRDILEIISQSRDDDAPVFDAVLRNSAILCGASMASLDIMSEDRSHAVLVAHWGENTAELLPVGTTVWWMDADHAPPTCMREGRIVHIHDMADTDLYRSGDPMRVTAVEREGIRTFLAVPLFSRGRTVGCIEIYRREVRPFTHDGITLVETFAAQAVIAIENVRQFRELQARLEREAASREILQVISQNRDNDRPVFELITRSAALLCGAPVCTLWRVESGIIHYCASYGLHGEGLAEAELTPAEPLAENTMTSRVFSTRAVARLDDATDESYIDYEWVRARGLKYLVGVPIFVGGEVWGSINPMWPPDRAPRDADIQLVEGFAAQAAIAIENVRQFAALEALNAELGDRVQAQVDEIERMGRLKRFLPAAVADTVVSSGSEKMLSSHRALLGALFCDIRGFTAFCETAEPEETIEVLQTYHEEMGKLINSHGAGVDLRMGDGIMVLFNDPLPCDDPAGEAVRLAIAMRARMAELCLKWKRLGHRLGFGVGVSLGYANIGIVGFEGRFDYTASGTPINLASRLCDEAQDGEILLSPRAAIAVEDRFPVEPRGTFTLKGMREPVEVFRLTGIAEA